MRNYRAGKFTNAIAQFDKALACHPKDKLSTTYIERCHHLISHAPDAGWNGVWVMTQK
jgi:adenylate cyclase